MKKITLLCFMILASYGLNAQDTCASAVAITPGVTTVGIINGSEVPQPICANGGEIPIANSPAGEWYSFTPTQDGVYFINSNLPQNIGGDTRVHIYTGTCGNLTCAGGNDDVDSTTFLSEAFFNAVSGTTYYIAWDNRWSIAGFDFELSLNSNTNCDVIFPYSQDGNDIDGDLKWQVCWSYENFGTGSGWTFNGFIDVDGDGTEDDFINIIPQMIPAPAKDAWTISPAINMTTNNEYEITITYNAVNFPGLVANESFDLVILDDKTSSAPNQTIVGSFTNITMQGTETGSPNLFDAAYVSTETFTPTSDGTYYLGVHANSAAGGSLFFVKQVEIVENTLSTEDFEALNFNYFVDAQKYLNLSANEQIESVTLHNLLGKQVLNQRLSAQNESIDLNSLSNGVYLVQAQINNVSKTFKIVKK